MLSTIASSVACYQILNFETVPFATNYQTVYGPVNRRNKVTVAPVKTRAQSQSQILPSSSQIRPHSATVHHHQDSESFVSVSDILKISSLLSIAVPCPQTLQVLTLVSSPPLAIDPEH